MLWDSGDKENPSPEALVCLLLPAQARMQSQLSSGSRLLTPTPTLVTLQLPGWARWVMKDLGTPPPAPGAFPQNRECCCHFY